MKVGFKRKKPTSLLWYFGKDLPVCHKKIIGQCFGDQVGIMYCLDVTMFTWGTSRHFHDTIFRCCCCLKVDFCAIYKGNGERFSMTMASAAVLNKILCKIRYTRKKKQNKIKIHSCSLQFWNLITAGQFRHQLLGPEKSSIYKRRKKKQAFSSMGMAGWICL